jgi:hypothetical protein
MDFTGRPMRGFVFVDCGELTSERELEFWLELALAFNPMATRSVKKKKAI